MDRRSFVLASVAALAGMPGLVTRAIAQSAYPGKPVTLLCPFAAGGAGDIWRERVAEELQYSNEHGWVSSGVHWRSLCLFALQKPHERQRGRDDQ